MLLIKLNKGQHWMFKYPYLDEVGKVISTLHDRKSPGAKGLHSEVIRSGGRQLVKVLYLHHHKKKLGKTWKSCRLEGCPINHHFDVLLWTPTYGWAKAGWPVRTYIQLLCEDTGCSPEDLPEAMNDWEKWRERVRDIRASDMTWWWWLTKKDRWDYSNYHGILLLFIQGKCLPVYCLTHYWLVEDFLTVAQCGFYGAFQKLLERYNKCIAAGGD